MDQQTKKPDIDEAWLNETAAPPPGDGDDRDKALADSFPASDPPSQP